MSEEPGAYDEAVRFCSRGITRAPANGLMYVERGRMSLLAHAYSEALADLVRAVDLCGDSWAAWHFCGIAGYITGDYEAAQDYFGEAIDVELSRDSVLVSTCWLWMTLLKRGDLTAAEEVAGARSPEVEAPENDWAAACERVLDRAAGRAQETRAAEGGTAMSEASITVAYGDYMRLRYVEKDDQGARQALEGILAVGADTELRCLAFCAALGEK